jgi:signal peptidase II
MPAGGPTDQSKIESGPRGLDYGKSKIQRILAYRWLWICVVLALSLDQWSKAWITARLPLGSYGKHGLTIFPGFLNLVHVGNTGAAWSMFTGKSTVLAVIAVATLAAIFIWRRQLGLRLPSAQICFGLLCGGTVGNLCDRILRGHVVDFLDFHFGRYTYPTFNVADSAIFLGVFGYVLWSLKQPEPRRGDAEE